MKRSEGEHIRMRHSIERMKATMVNLEKAVSFNGPIGNDVSQAVLTTACEIAMQIAKHDAYLLAEEDSK